MCNLYDLAINVCTHCSLSYQPVVEGLASKCVQITQGQAVIDENETWEWLANNDRSALPMGDKETVVD